MGGSLGSSHFSSMFGLFKKFKDGLAKTVSAIAAKTHGLFGGRKIDASSIGELEEALITADFGVETTAEILAEIKAAYRKDAALKGQQAAAIGVAVLKQVLAGSEGRLESTMSFFLGVCRETRTLSKRAPVEEGVLNPLR